MSRVDDALDVALWSPAVPWMTFEPSGRWVRMIASVVAGLALSCAAGDGGLLADAGREGDAGRPADDARASFVVLPDTQFYACAYPEIFEAQVDWIVAETAPRGIAVVLHTGDIVDAPSDRSQWEVAAQSLHRLDEVIPYVIATGNHDILADRSSLVGEYFDPDTLPRTDVVSGYYEADRPDNAFAIIELAGESWLFLGLEFAPRDAVVQWARDVLQEHAALPAVVFTHAYLYSDAERYDRSLVPPQPYHPDDYGLPVEEGVNDGEDLWRKLIEPHENVALVLSGHVIPDGTARSTSLRASGSQVHEVLANYQRCDTCPCAEVQGGGGYLRVIELDPASRRLHVTTYSPFLDESLQDDENAFDLDLD